MFPVFRKKIRNCIKSAAPVALGLTMLKAVFLLLSAEALAQPDPGGPDPTQICGDVVVTGTEDCEIGVPMTATCETLPGPPIYAAGVLGCTSGCTFDSSQCVVSICGNGFVESPEICDHDMGTAPAANFDSRPR
jgi:hypothetical protein